ncbi:hypothetical protein MSC49_14060 [Methylosinus sp. C49]|uniref:hypothetical protein n=1 Tax=Methylosinus sp. C49 TaxID=2699395 RepID=UPI001366E4C9|nr:hypothetical protein [Methylosinus sp. C49]BBU61471.1 hypothetical protein MSC49_14060 [Methylosinus sp. C49]
MRFFIGLLLGFSVGTVLSVPILILISVSVAKFQQVMGLPTTFLLQFPTAFLLVYSVFAACSIRFAKPRADSILAGFLVTFPIVCLALFALLTIGED